MRMHWAPNHNRHNGPTRPSEAARIRGLLSVALLGVALLGAASCGEDVADVKTSNKTQAPAPVINAGKNAAGTSATPSATQQTAPILVDVKARRISVRGAVAKQDIYEELEGVIEYVACCPGGKEYEALFICAVDPEALYQAFDRIGVEAGTPAYEKEGRIWLPQGARARVRIFVEWTAGGKNRREPIETFILDTVTKKPMRTAAWMFTGSRRSQDPETGREVLEATITKNLISLHQQDASVLIQNPRPDARDENRYKANHAALPPEGAAVRLIFEPAAAPVDSAAAKGRRIHAFVSGKVQDVGYRAFTQRMALSLGIRGWVRNLPGGEVELMAEGPDEAMAAFDKKIRKGTRWSKVAAVRLAESSDAELLGTFDILPTPAAPAAPLAKP